MSLLQEFTHLDEGFTPMLIGEKWQIAQLNYCKDQEINNIKSIDIHLETDEVFVLLEGSAVLITAEKKDNNFLFETTYMEPNVVYNVPKMCWHNIALDKKAKVLIVEDKDSHLGKYRIEKLNDLQAQNLAVKLNNAVKSKTWN